MVNVICIVWDIKHLLTRRQYIQYIQVPLSYMYSD